MARPAKDTVNGGRYCGLAVLKQITLALVILLSTSFASAQEISPQLDPELAGITDRGRILAEHDMTTWRSTDAVLAMKPKKGSVARVQ